jgi:hypothetical protein
MKFGAKKNPTVLAEGSRFAPNFIQNLYTVLKKRLWESRSTPTLVSILDHQNVIFWPKNCHFSVTMHSQNCEECEEHFFDHQICTFLRKESMARVM